MKTEQQRLDRLVETLAGATLLINDAHQLTYVSQHAAEQLGFSDRRELLGQSATSVFDPERLIAAGDGQHNAQWVNAEQLAIDVVYQQTPLSGTGERMLNFTLAPPASAAASSPAVSQQQGLASSIKAPIINGADHSDKSGDHATTPSLLFGQQQKGSHARPGRHLSVPIEEYEDGAQAYLGQLAAYLVNGSANSEQVSVLILGVMLRMGDGVLVPVSSQPEVATLVHDSMLAIYRRENHVAQLSDHHYGFILCHREAPLSYLLTRKIMQLCNDTPLPVHLKGKAELCVNGCLTAISTSREDTAQAVLSRALSGLHAVDVRGVNQALLLELKRMLPVYPAT